ncbi:DUF2971 domain-containing protein [Polaromonas sp. CG_23.6]|uniref:DUF2971 domain-containing protein n=1 Tax=Polaromonas sp. CG_23.6 TaxID=2760709 RepID=UPI002475C3FC|nr:DUF2971 domain-containing protein [Polaromonas sp. CG_23.6]MDH6185280.1 hypothetical protein [Polaromonas sp. CG_23.6]
MPHDDCLYHYCSTQTFHAIVDSKTIRLSSLALSNDSLEGKIVPETVRKLIKPLGKEHEELLSEIKVTEDHLGNALGFCLSEAGDLLSQWRGYAMDGMGLSIGFSRKYLDQFMIPINRTDEIELNKVEYFTDAKVIAEFEGFAKALDADKANNYADVRQYIRSRQSYMYGLHRQKFRVKSDAFKEEQEWRLLTFRKGDFFRPASNCLIPYIEFSLDDPAAAITKVVLGPKHVTPTEVVEEFLKKSGFTNADVSQSRASYR